MCGIVGAVAKREIPEILLEGLKRLEYRGYDSAGIAVLDTDAKLQRRRTLGKVQQLVDDIAANPVQGCVGIAHTRWATHGVPAEINAHPHMSGDRVSIVHNGIIENYEELRAELQAEGYVFESATDSETVAHLVHHYLSSGLELREAVRQTVTRLDGAYAIGVVCTDEPDRIVAARSGSPLVVGKGIGENFIASDVLALKVVTDRFIFLEEGDLVEITRDSIDIWNVEDESVIRTSVRVEMGHDDIDKGNYRHHMQKEIFEQPTVITNTLEGRLGRTQVLEQAFGVEAKGIFDQVQAVTIVACGTSFYAGSVARYWIEEIAGIPCQVEVASEFRYRKLAVTPNNLFVTITQSGETADTLAALRIAKEVGYFATLTICNVPTSSTVRESDLALMIQAGTEVGVASTKAFTAQLTDLLVLTTLLGRRHGMAKSCEKEIVAALHELPAVIEKVLNLDTRLT
ncbi:MAG: glutamine--fructose-6-phosphate transaminase (isomerizing), partial [Pseudomonadales bacterium]